MKYRALVKQGGGLTITLPAKWVRENGLEKGDIVKVDELQDGCLVIRKLVP